VELVSRDLLKWGVSKTLCGIAKYFLLQTLISKLSFVGFKATAWRSKRNSNVVSYI
jgi:hypothetical protein